MALANGADLAGVVKAGDLTEHLESMDNILLEADSVIVKAVGNNRTALATENIQAMQLEISFTYAEATIMWIVRRLRSAIRHPSRSPSPRKIPPQG